MPAFRRRTAFAAPVIVTVAAGCSRGDRAAPASDVAQTFEVVMSDMKCHAARREIECPPGMSGNMTMKVVERRDGVCMTLPGKHVTPCPLPEGQHIVRKLGLIWTIEKRGEDCHAEEEDACPPGIDCNPPKPRTFKCPPGVTEEKPLRFAEMPDTSCVIVPDDCTDTSCATVKVDCPPEYQP